MNTDAAGSVWAAGTGPAMTKRRDEKKNTFHVFTLFPDTLRVPIAMTFDFGQQTDSEPVLKSVR
jgi:hypothetical protein